MCSKRSSESGDASHLAQTLFEQPDLVLTRKVAVSCNLFACSAQTASHPRADVGDVAVVRGML
jgi:hypothetical protein